MSTIRIENMFERKFSTTQKTVMGKIVHLPSQQNHLFILNSKMYFFKYKNFFLYFDLFS